MDDIEYGWFRPSAARVMHVHRTLRAVGAHRIISLSTTLLEEMAPMGFYCLPGANVLPERG